ELAKVSTDVSTQDALVQIHLKSLDTTLDKMSVRVNKLEDSSSQEWLLSEIEYLMKMADHRMLMKDDVKGAIALLKSADAVISNMPVKDAGLNKVRVAIAEDITALELYEAIDVPGIYAELVALAGLVEKLPMVPLEQEEVEEASADVSTDEVSLLDKINSSMGQYLTVRRYNDTELEKMLTRDQRNFVKGSMLLSLEQAQTAVLRSDQSIYDDNLNAVRATLISYFKSGSYQVDIAKLKLNKLIGVKIEAELPAISGSQQAINRYISEKVRTR
ncbi:MAG: uroporphyrinogen-III C-methyltransferase, partial [Sinobacterium sp.]|nr:uroporphyrinogen-III C-methyltransferase [Sinobacterium sp.]